MRQTVGDDWCGWRLAQDWREMEVGGHTSHSHYIGDSSTQCQCWIFVSLDWSDYNFQELSFPAHYAQTDTIKHKVKKDTFIVGQQSVSKSYLISVDVVTSLFILLMLFLF